MTKRYHVKKLAKLRKFQVFCFHSPHIKHIAKKFSAIHESYFLKIGSRKMTSMIPYEHLKVFYMPYTDWIYKHSVLKFAQRPPFLLEILQRPDLEINFLKTSFMHWIMTSLYRIHVSIKPFKNEKNEEFLIFYRLNWNRNVMTS